MSVEAAKELLKVERQIERVRAILVKLEERREALVKAITES